MTRRWRTGWIVIGIAALAACQGTPPAPSAASAPVSTRGHPLSGTTWELVAIQSPTEADSVQIAKPARFTLRFGPGRSVVLRLDCNRGAGTWRPGASPDDTSLRFGTIATTRALCEPPQLDERVARDLGKVRSYALRDDRLYLSPTADGGTLEWRPRAEK